ncbi:MAG: MMPL family transporter [Alphaproteobacteria bacterium]|nr:MMPL family transporter [Alphaproteobacteria bacterium]
MADKPDVLAPSFEARYARWVVAARWPVIAASIIVVLLAGTGGLFLKFSTNYRIFFNADNPELLAYEALEHTYGKTDNILFMIVPEGGDATSEQALSASVWLTERAWKTPYSKRVDSLANFPHTTADGDELSVRDLVAPGQLGQERARNWIRETALADPRLLGSLLARDGSVSAVNVTVELPEENQAIRVPEVAAFADTVAAEAKERFPGIGFRVVGSVMINHTFSEASVNSQKIFLPASLGIMALILGILTRSITGVGTTGLVIVFSIIASMGLGGWVGLPFTPPTAPAPTIVLMIVVANCVHLLVALRQRLRVGDDKRAAVIEAVRLNLYPIFLASLTTALGFLSMNFSEVPPYRDLGNFVAFGIGASFLLSITFLPALLSLLPVRAPVAKRREKLAVEAIAEFVIRRRKVLLLGSVPVVLALLAAIPRNELNDVLVHFFDETTEFRQNTDFLDQRLSGNTQFEYSLAASGPGDVIEPAFLADVANFAEWYREQPETRHVEVITDTFRQLNKSMHGDDPAAYDLPANRELAAQYLLLYELSLPQGLDLNHRIDLGHSATRMTVTTRTLSSQAVLDLNDRAEAWLQVNAPHIVNVDSSGPALLFGHIGQRNIRAMLLGTGMALLGISAVLLVALRSLRLGLVSLVPNFVPAIMGFGIWGLAVGQVGLALSVVVAMTIGIVVDDTVHFLSKYLRARREHHCTPEDAVRYAFQTAGQALVTTTIVLIAGFLILVFSPFIPTAQVGLLTAMIIGCALLADLVLLPTLLMTIDRGSQVAGRLRRSPRGH